MDRVFSLLLCICYLTAMLVDLSPESIYLPEDGVTIFNSENIFSELYNSSNLWLVEFFLNWCHQCHEFAPIYKALAKDIASWSWVIKLGAIDCGDTASSGKENYLICHQKPFWISDYPEFRYYYPFSNRSNGGTEFKTDFNIRKMRENLLSIIELNLDDINWNHSTLKPNFSPIRLADVFNIVQSKFSSNLSNFVFVFENEDSLMGKEIILDLSSCSGVVVRRVVVDSSSMHLLQNLTTSIQLPIVMAACSNGSFVTINVAIKTRYFYVYQLERLSGVGPVQARTLIQIASNVSLQRNERRIIKRDLVYLADIESGLRYFLTVEASSHKILTGGNLKAIQNLVSLLASVGNYFPGRKSTINFIHDLSRWSKLHESITSDEWLKKVNEKKSNSFLPETSKLWAECQSTDELPRAYPCSLWIIFHALSAAVFNADIDREILPKSIQDYVKHFFGCRKCRRNFEKEIKELPYISTENNCDVILWLWKIHNKVNKRLSKFVSHKSNHSLKIQFPPPELCDQCRNPSTGDWIEEEVALFLLRRYSAESISWEHLDVNIEKDETKIFDKSIFAHEYSLAKSRYLFHPRGLDWNTDSQIRSNIFLSHIFKDNILLVQLLIFVVFILSLVFYLRKIVRSKCKISKKLKHVQ